MFPFGFHFVSAAPMRRRSLPMRVVFAPLRPVVDRAVLQLIDAVTFTGADFFDLKRRLVSHECAASSRAYLGALC